MTKEELQYGNVVELRNGHKYLLYGQSGLFKDLKGIGISGILKHHYNNRLENRDTLHYDIMKVYKDYTLKELLWERKEIILTDDEKAILRNIDKEYKYIKRDNEGDLFVYQDFYMSYIHVFNHLFKFIDKGSYLIEDLLKGGLENE